MKSNKVFIKDNLLINIDKKLSLHYIIPFAGYDLYRIGLSLFKPGPFKRKSLYNPWLAYIIIAGYSIKWLFSMIVLKENDRDLALYLGDWLFFMPKEIRLHLGVAVIAYFCNGLIFPIIHYKYYFKGKEPTYLRPFHMMSGAVTPRSIGLTDKRDVQKLLKTTELLLKCAYFLIASGIPSAVIVAGVPFCINHANSFELIFLVVPGVLSFTLAVHFTANHLVFQIIYFHIICYYLKLKIKRINSELSSKTSKSQNLKILMDLISIHKEVIDFNDNYWSEYLAVIMLIVMPVLNLLTFTVIFGGFQVIYKHLFIYFILLFGLFLLFISMTASSVSSEANKSHKLLLNLLYKQRKLGISVKMKVRLSKVYLS